MFHPALVKELFQGPGEQLRAGEANAMLGPVVGERSVLLLDGTEHLRHRRLLLGPFHGRRMQAFADAMRRASDLEIDAWPVGEPFALLSSMQSLTLRVIMQAVFGYEPGAEEEELRRIDQRIRHGRNHAHIGGAVFLGELEHAYGIEAAHHHLLDTHHHRDLRTSPTIGVEQRDGVQLHTVVLVPKGATAKGSPTTLKAGRPGATCTWTSTARASIPSNATVVTRWTMGAPALAAE